METVEQIREIIAPVLDEMGLEVVEIQLRSERGRMVLRIIIYKEEGISIDDCSRVSREAGYLLEVEDLIGRAYTLEVSSPGLDRPLKTKRDFERNIGKKITVLFEEIEERYSVTGIVEKIAEDQLTLKDAKKVITIPLANIVKATLVIEF
jgi:ribosome maturation factor RimP